MKKTLTALIVLLALGLIASGCPGESGQNDFALGKITGVSTDSTQSPQVGKPAPDFYFENPEGESTSLSQLQGKPVLLNFWATWCGPCVYEMPFLEQIYEEWPDEELVLLGVNIGESSTQAAEFMQSNGLSFTVLLDSETAVAQKYKIKYIPTTFLIDKEGVIKETQVGAFRGKAEIENMLGQID
jgi:cytochrome c biogenesis protein CcmG/thiol:disulfide interchange protein DsbE